MRATTRLLGLGLPLFVACARDGRSTTVQPSAPPAAPPQSPRRMHGMHAPSAHGEHALVDPGAADAEPVRDAIAVLHPTAGNRTTGTVRFTAVDAGGLDLIATIEGLPAGTHAYHVHVYGDCSSPDATSAGPHFHFTGSSFDKTVKMITGNLGELTAQQDGRATHRTRLPSAALHGPFSVIGRAVIVHAKPNDPSVTPDGGAGARIACGVIGVASSSATEPAPTTTSRR